MAKKKKKEPKEVFTEPEFSEVEFMETEIENTKCGLIAIVYAIPVALVSFGLTLIGLAGIGFLVGVFSLFTLRTVYQKLGIRTKGFERKTWMGNGALMFFVWLLIWILLLNPPFSDVSKPSIIQVELWTQDTDGNWTLAQRLSGNYEATPVENVTAIKLKANVTDNGGIGSVSVIFESTTYNMNRNNTHPYQYEYDHTLSDAGEFYYFTIRAVDKSDNVNEILVTVPT